MPGPQKSLPQFQDDQAACQQFAQASLGGVSANDAAAQSAAASATIGALLGAATGAILGSVTGQAGQGAAIGAGTGLLFGGAAGVNASGYTWREETQRRYDFAYAQCMYTRGNTPPGAVAYRGAPAYQVYSYPPPNAPPPPGIASGESSPRIRARGWRRRAAPSRRAARLSRVRCRHRAARRRDSAFRPGRLRPGRRFPCHRRPTHRLPLTRHPTPRRRRARAEIAPPPVTTAARAAARRIVRPAAGTNTGGAAAATRRNECFSVRSRSRCGRCDSIGRATLTGERSFQVARGRPADRRRTACGGADLVSGRRSRPPAASCWRCGRGGRAPRGGRRASGGRAVRNAGHRAAVTAIESSLIVSVMLAGGEDKAALARTRCTRR